MNILALDWGTKRIGVAFLNTDLNVPIPLDFIVNDRNCIKQIGIIISQRMVAKIILGLPKKLDGQESSSVEKVRKFAKVIEQELKINIEFLDERFTTTVTQKKLIGSKNKKEAVDSLAALEILENYSVKNF